MDLFKNDRIALITGGARGMGVVGDRSGH